MTDGLLYVLSQPAPGQEAAYHEWYDGEHAPDRMRLPGFDSCFRYHAVDAREPAWLAYYDMQIEALDTPAYRRLRERRSPTDRAALASLPILDRRVYELVSGVPGRLDPPPFLVATSLSVPADRQRELDDWYDQEHLPMLRETPGWLGIRRYRLRAGSAPENLALHGVSTLAAFDTPQYQAATSTPRRAAIMASVTARERRVFAFHTEIHG